MQLPDTKAATRWFHSYVQRFAENGGLCHLQELKLVHSNKVAGHSERIASHSGFDSDKVKLARIAGLLHDIGRFPQLEKYATFVDPKRVNHAELGYEVLVAEDPQDFAADTDRNQVFQAVRYHNCLAVPAEADQEAHWLIDIARDADKLDIFRIVHGAIDSGELRRRPEILWNVDVDGPPSEKLACDVASGRPGSYEDVKTLADYLMIQLGWIFDINYPASMELISEQGIIEKIITYLPEDENVNKAVFAAIQCRDDVLSRA